MVPAGGTGTSEPITGTYLAYVRYMNADGVFSPIGPASVAITIADVDQCYGILYSGA